MLQKTFFSLKIKIMLNPHNADRIDSGIAYCLKSYHNSSILTFEETFKNTKNYSYNEIKAFFRNSKKHPQMSPVINYWVSS